LTKKDDKGMMALLLLLGHPTEIIKEVQAQWDEEKE
jgi:hypothetical protein